MDNIPVTNPMPREVTQARYLLIGSLLLQLIPVPVELMSFVSKEQHGLAMFFVVLVAAVGGLTLFLISKIKQRKNWARWVMFVSVLLGAASTLYSLQENWNESVGGALLDCLTGLMELVALGILFARRGNDWFANQLEIQSPLNPDSQNQGESGVTSMGYICPSCGLKIAFLSKVVQSMGKGQTCPYCNQKIKRDMAYGKFFALMFLVGLPIKLLGKAIPALSFLGSSGTTALITGLLIMLCMRFKKDTSV